MVTPMGYNCGLFISIIKGGQRMKNFVTISRAHHYIRLTDFTSEFSAKVIIPFCRQHLYKYVQEPDPNTRELVWKVGNVFARFNNDKTEFRMSKGFLALFVDTLAKQGYPDTGIVFLDEPEVEPKPLKLTFKEGWGTPRPNQVDYIEYQNAPGSLKVNNATMGAGKQQRLDANIKIPGGWKKMGDMKVGDTVIARDGTHSKVLGVFPQGVSEVYRVVMSDGRETTAGPEHLWGVFTQKGTKAPKSRENALYDVLDTSALISELAKGNKVSIPLCLPEVGTAEEHLAFLITHPLSRFPRDYSGYVKDTSIVSSKERALAYQYAIRALGGICSIRELHSHHLRSWVIDYEMDLSLQTELKLEIKSIEKLPDAETQCIMIDHPEHLYVTDDFIVTHNTFMALSTMMHTKQRTLFILQPKYIAVWVKAFGEQVEYGLEDVLILDGETIEDLHKAYLTGVVNADVVILPQTRIQMYLKKMKLDPTLPSLDTVFNDIGFGLRIYDEAHESFHQIYTSLLFGNIKKTIFLSATMKSDDQFTNAMYDIVASRDKYLKETEHRQYIETYAYHYRIDQRRFFIGHKSMGSYSDIMFEKNMMRSHITRNFYLGLVYKAFKEFYNNRRVPGTKCIIFFTKTDTVERFKNYLLERHPDYDVINFTGVTTKKKESKNDYLKHEIVVTTPGSCGTGKDIPGLITVLCSHNVSSSQRNDQIIGRVRDTKGWFTPDLPPQFVYFVCDDIPKHREYHDKRKSLFFSKSAFQKNIDSHCHLN